MSEKDTGIEEVIAESEGFEQAIRDRDARVQADTATKLLSGLRELGMGTEKPSPVEAAVTANPQDRTGAVPARSAGKTQPAMEALYRNVPWQQGGDVRSYAGDLEIKEWLVATAQKDHNKLQIMAARTADQMRQLVIEPTDATSGLGTGSAGATVPLPLSNLLTTLLQRNATMRQICQVFTSPASTLRVAVQSTHTAPAWVDSGTATSGMVSEDTAIAEANPAYINRLLTKKKIAVMTRVTNELLADSAFNVASLVATETAQSLASAEDAAFAGTPVAADGEPTQGLDGFAATLVGTHNLTPIPGTPTALTNGLLQGLYFGVHKPYRAGAVWACNDASLALLSDMEDTQGRPILNFQNNPLSAVDPGGVPGAIGTIMNRPVVEIPCADTFLYFGDFRRAMFILDDPSVSAMASEHAAFADDVVLYRFTHRVDSVGGSGGATGQPTFLVHEIAAQA